jgi:non-specific serine/threonine protein kinase
MIDQTISHYKILEKIGAGGMGVVYKAEDIKLKRTVALKFLPPELTRDPEAKKRFLHEARAASALDHPNICNIFEIDETDDGQLFIAMGYYEGQTLKEKISGGGENGGSPLPIHEAINITIQIAEGLNKAHQKDIIHRDIKSANIMITDEEVVKILDFGLAKLRGATKLTKEGTTLGTVAYMSPEQASGDKVDHRSDIWSLGVILYEMITGQLPFKGEYEQAVMYAIMNEEPEPITGLRTGIPLELEIMINKVLSKNLSERYQNLEELIVDIKRVKKNLTTGEKYPISKRKPKPFKKQSATAVIALLIIIIAGYFTLIKKSIINEPEIQKTVKKSSITQTKWKNSIAVLPFSNISADKEQEYFCDGMTEDIITKLTHIQNLKVISRTSVMQYKNTTKTIKQIGRELAVNNILEGSVRKEKSRIRITAQLIRVADDAHLWAKNYDRNLESVFDVQDEVSKTIAETLKVTLTPEILLSFQSDRPKNIQAYEYYLKGLHIFHSRFFISFKDEDFKAARRMLTKALEIDPEFTKAYNRLIYFHALHFVLLRKESDIKMMKIYADRAVKLDPHSAMGYAGLGLTTAFKGNFDKAYPLYKKALKINPNDPIIHYQIVAFYIPLKLYNKAFEFCIRAMEVDPLYFPSYLTGARCQFYLGNYEKCEYYLKQAFEILPNQLNLIDLFAQFFLRQKKFDQANEWIKKLEAVRPDSNTVKRLRSILFALTGNEEKALAAGYESEELYSILGMKEEAINYLQKYLDKNSLRYNYLYLLHSPYYDNLRNDPRFQKIMEKAKTLYEERLKKYGDL